MSKLREASLSYTFDDFVLVPVYSKIKSRKDPDISTKISGFDYKIPVVSSPMNTITETEMLITMHNLGGVGVLHRYMNTESQIEIIKEVQPKLSNLPDRCIPFYVAVGANGSFKERVMALNDAGAFGFCVDVANGHNERSIQAVRAIRELIPNASIMGGNVCTFDGAYRLAEAGCNAIRIGIGSGSLCTTRQVTGHGISQLTAIENCARIKGPYPVSGFPRYPNVYPNVSIIADGGVRGSGDAVKALAAGADAVMIGSMLSGTEETPGEWLEEDGKLYKYFHGMASEEGRAKWKNQFKTGAPIEGVSTKVLYTGKTAEKVVQNLCASIKVGLSFSGANDLEELRNNAQWSRITSAGYVEGTPHGK